MMHVVLTKAVQMLNLTVAIDLVSMVHGHVTVMVTVQTLAMKLAVLLQHVLTMVMQVVQILMMALHVFIHHGFVMATQTVQMVLMKLIALLHHVLIKDYGTVVMVNVFQTLMFVMDLPILVMQVGVQTVRMAQMKV